MHVKRALLFLAADQPRPRDHRPDADDHRQRRQQAQRYEAAGGADRYDLAEQ